MKFEDKISVQDLMKKPQKELLTMIYIQTVKTNGQVRTNTGDIETLQSDVKSKIGWKIFVVGTSILTAVILMFNLINLLGG